MRELEAVFSDKKLFNYYTRTIALNDEKDPQLQLNGAMIDFVMAHDHRYNLLIVYYSGHGKFLIEEEMLELYA